METQQPVGDIAGELVVLLIVALLVAAADADMKTAQVPAPKPTVFQRMMQFLTRRHERLRAQLSSAPSASEA
jgi:hypothetical protein